MTGRKKRLFVKEGYFKEDYFKEGYFKAGYFHVTHLALFLILVVQIGICVYFGSQKSGFHEDEFYSFYSTNKTAGLFTEDREWMEKEQYRNEFVVLPEERFRYGLVAQMQSWDVHPPLYYFLLHTACSLFPGVFSKWMGIGINLLAFALNFILLAYLTGMADAQEKTAGDYRRGGLRAAVPVCAVWGLAPAVISGVMFIRMYEWLTLFILFCACLHARAIVKGEFKLFTFYLPLAATVYLGFLTQYYYIIFHFFIGLGFCGWLLRESLRERTGASDSGKSNGLKRGLLRCCQYGAACAVGLGAALLSYPAALSHIFRGYRGTEAVSEFGNISNTWERLLFFLKLLDQYVFGGILPLVFAVAVVFFLINAVRGKALFNGVYYILLLACAGYFFTISKTALLLGETSNRYQLPIYGIIIMLLIITLLRGTFSGASGIWNQVKRAFGMALVLLLLVLNCRDLLTQDKVLFLYREQAESMAYAREHADADVVVFYNEASAANVWRLSDELMEYSRIYLLNGGNREPINDPVIQKSNNLLVYIATQDDADYCGQMILEANPGLTEVKRIAEKDLWSLYEYS